MGSKKSTPPRSSHFASLQMRATKAALQTIQMTHTEREMNGDLLRQLQGNRGLQERVRYFSAQQAVCPVRRKQLPSSTGFRSPRPYRISLATTLSPLEPRSGLYLSTGKREQSSCCFFPPPKIGEEGQDDVRACAAATPFPLTFSDCLRRIRASCFRAFWPF